MSKTSTEQAVEAILGIILDIPTSILTAMLQVFVAMKCYFWFLVPVGAPQLSYLTIWGIGLAFLALTRTSKLSESTFIEEKGLLYYVVTTRIQSVFASLFILLHAYIIKCIMGG